MITVSRLTRIEKDTSRDVNALLRQLVHDPTTYRPVSLKRFQEIVNDKKTVVVVVRDRRRIVGVGILLSINKLRGRYGYIEDMIVDSLYRGRGLGKRIGQKLIAIARAQKIKTLELSARPSRVPANNLYEKLGFIHKKTYVYRLKL